MLPPTREHDFRNIAVFVFGPPFRVIFDDFTSVLHPEVNKNNSEHAFKKSLVFDGLFVSFRMTLGTLWGTLLAPKITPKPLPGRSRGALGPPRIPPRAPGALRDSFLRKKSSFSHTLPRLLFANNVFACYRPTRGGLCEAH